jgi:hypothetical protein
MGTVKLTEPFTTRNMYKEIYADEMDKTF